LQEDESQPDRDQDLKPRFHTSRLHGSEDFDDDVRDLLFVSFETCTEMHVLYDTYILIL
jgi:hypothetical protein